ncbi:hypothetical protein ACIOYV_19050 [Pseudomonas sp. NPDC087342]|uniref:hypothetical protein n=1 Tax=Pseudomonas sp. NPDC087342 TaxID=3364437 RepID=UPI0038054610
MKSHKMILTTAGIFEQKLLDGSVTGELHKEGPAGKPHYSSTHISGLYDHKPGEPFRLYVSSENREKSDVEAIDFDFKEFLSIGRHEISDTTKIGIVVALRTGGLWLAKSGFVFLESITPSDYRGRFEVFQEHNQKGDSVKDGRFIFIFGDS